MFLGGNCPVNGLEGEVIRKGREKFVEISGQCLLFFDRMPSLKNVNVLMNYVTSLPGSDQPF